MFVNKNKTSEEWFKQADYDLDTAKAMFETDRYIYVVFMCHLSIEKALKGLYAQQLKEIPPKIHSLIFFSEKLQLKLPIELETFLNTLNDLSVPTRYPENLESLLKEYKKDKTNEVFLKTREILK